MSHPDDVLEELFVPEACLRLPGEAAHGADAVERVVTLGSLPGQHDAVRSVQDGVGDVRSLGAGRTGLLHHGLEHLGGADDGLPCLEVTFFSFNL